MTSLYNKTYLNNIKKQKNKLLALYLILLGVVLLIEAGIIVYYALQPFGNNLTEPLKILMFSIAIVFVLFSGVYLSITYGRVLRYYQFLLNLLYSKKAKLTATVISIGYETKTSAGVDFYTMDVLEWSETQNDYVKHIILIDNEFKNLDINEGDIITITTSLNALMEYSKN